VIYELAARCWPTSGAIIFFLRLGHGGVGLGAGRLLIAGPVMRTHPLALNEATADLAMHGLGAQARGLSDLHPVAGREIKSGISQIPLSPGAAGFC